MKKTTLGDGKRWDGRRLAVCREKNRFCGNACSTMRKGKGVVATADGILRKKNQKRSCEVKLKKGKKNTFFHFAKNLSPLKFLKSSKTTVRVFHAAWGREKTQIKQKMFFVLFAICWWRLPTSLTRWGSPWRFKLRVRGATFRDWSGVAGWGPNWNESVKKLGTLFCCCSEVLLLARDCPVGFDLFFCVRT